MTAIILLTLVCPACSRVISNSLHKSSWLCHFTYQHTISHYTVEIHTSATISMEHMKHQIPFPSRSQCLLCHISSLMETNLPVGLSKVKEPLPPRVPGPWQMQVWNMYDNSEPEDASGRKPFRIRMSSRWNNFFFFGGGGGTFISLSANVVLTFVGPCIVIYFYSTTNQMHNTSNLFYFRTTLYIFQTVSLSIIRSLRLYIQHHTIQVLWLLASKQPQNLYDIYLMLYVQS